MAEEKKGRTLVEHAAYELTKAGMANNPDPEARQVATNTIALVRRIEKMNMTEKQAAYVIEAFSILTQFLPLTPITDDPEEWDKFEIDRKNVDTGEVEKKVVWQSRRATSIFSEDEGKTFIDQRTGKVGESVDHIKQAEEAKAAQEARDKRRAENEARTKQPTAVLADQPAGEVSAAPEAPAASTPEAPAEQPQTETPEESAAPKEETK